MKIPSFLLICLPILANITANAQGTSPTTTALLALPNSQIQGGPIFLFASVAPTSGSGVPTGSVSLSVFGLVNQSFPLADGLVAVEIPGTVTSVVPPGSYTISAIYSGDTNYATSNDSVTETIDQAGSTTSTTTTLTSSSNSVEQGVSVTFTAFVKPASGNGIPTGEIVAGIDGSPQTILQLDTTGHATYTTSTLAVGQHTISAQYLGDANYTTSTGSLTQTVTQKSYPVGALQFVPVTPCRVADTRNSNGPFGGPELGAQNAREFDIPQSACNIPSTAVAYSLNVTAVPNASLNYLTLWPTGESQPNVSTLNSDGRVKANAAITPAGANGGVNVFVSDASNIILDIDGYFVAAGADSALAFYPVLPCRIVDTRNAAGPLGGPSLTAGSSRSFPIQSNCGLPAGAQAYSLNVTAIPHNTLNYLTTWPTGEAQPNVSTLNSSTGATTANAAIVPAGQNGAVSIFVSDAADVILDVNGYFTGPDTNGLSLYTVTPCRIIDTRPNAFNGELTVKVQDEPCAPPSTPEAYVLNATVVPPSPLNYLSLWPDGAPQPNVSTLNANDGAITSNMAIVPTLNGSIDAFGFNPTNLILDISSYFAP